VTVDHHVRKKAFLLFVFNASN